MNYYVSNDGKIYGPIDEAKIRSKIAQGFFSRNCLVSLDRNEWTRPVTESAAAANAQNPAMQTEAATLPGATGPATAAQNPGNGYAIPLVPVEADSRSRKKRWIAIWIVVIIALLLIAGAVAVLAVDVLLLDRQLFSRIEDLFSGIF